MAVPKQVTVYLKKANKTFDELSHKTVYTAFDLAQTLKHDLREIAKALVVKVDKAYIIVIVPATAKVDLAKLKAAVGAKRAELPRENIMIKVLKVKSGAVTAFGGVHKLETWVDKGLLKTKHAIFQAGSFTDSVRMKVKDFVDMEEAKVAAFSMSGGYKKPKTQKKKVKKKSARKPAAKKPAAKKKTKK